MSSFSWKCFRGQKQIISNVSSDTHTQEFNKTENKVTDWLSNADDWGSDDDDILDSKDFVAPDACGNASLATHLSHMEISSDSEAQKGQQYFKNIATTEYINSNNLVTCQMNTTQFVEQDQNANLASDLPGMFFVRYILGEV